MLWDWKVGDTFQFFVQKAARREADTTDARYYIYDRAAKKWLHSATINSPNGDKKRSKRGDHRRRRAGLLPGELRWERTATSRSWPSIGFGWDRAWTR